MTTSDGRASSAATSDEWEEILLRARRVRSHYKDALQRIVDFPINEKASAGWHFAEVRQIAREALSDDD